MAQKFGIGFFSGVKFWSRDFLGVCLKPKGFFWVLIFAPFKYPCHLKSGVPPWAMCKIVVLPTIVCLIVFHVLVAVALSDFKVLKNNS